MGDSYSILILDVGILVGVGDGVLPDGARVIYYEQRSDAPTVHITTRVVAGRLTASRLELEMADGSALTQAALRSVRLNEILDRIALDATLWQRFQGTTSMSADELERVQRATASSRRRLTPELLREIADVAMADPDQPTRAVSEQLHTSHRNATRWIAAARRAGYLGQEGNR